VFQKRTEQENEEAAGQNGMLAAAETLRSAAGSSADKPGERKSGEEHLSLFWRVFGGTILSIVALAAVTLYNSLSSGITDLRNELNREREARAGLVKKEDNDTRSKTIFDRIRGLEGYKADIDTTRERVGANAAAIEGVRKDNAAALEAVKKDATAAVEAVKKDATAALDSIRKDGAGLDVLKERVASLEGVKKDIAALEVVKEKLASAAADLKTVRDELMKVQQELERNKASDLERKASRDLQAKQVEDALKEIQKGLLECRERIARLEGAQPVVGPPAPKVKGPTTNKDD
jgi:DNA repair exonuclease SbcCD ATPase subunit